MNRKYIIVGLIPLFVIACAQVPRGSVELSATVGRDLAKILFSRIRHDVNRFVDDIYGPYQIRNAMNRQWQLANSQNAKEQNKSLLIAINSALKPGASQQLQNAVLKGMGSMVRKIQEDVELMRKELLAPLNEQEEEVLGSIDRAYQQLHYANSIVTDHLSSVAKVHEAQAEMLQEIGIDRDLRNEVGKNLAKTSENIGALVEAAEKMDDKLEKAEENARNLKEIVLNLQKRLNGEKKEG